MLTRDNQLTAKLSCRGLACPVQEHASTRNEKRSRVLDITDFGDRLTDLLDDRSTAAYFTFQRKLQYLSRRSILPRATHVKSAAEESRRNHGPKNANNDTRLPHTKQYLPG